MCSAVYFVKWQSTLMKPNCFVQGVYCISTKGEYQQLLLDSSMRKLKGCQESLLLSLMRQDILFDLGLPWVLLCDQSMLFKNKMSMLPYVTSGVGCPCTFSQTVIAASDIVRRISGACLG